MATEDLTRSLNAMPGLADEKRILLLDANDKSRASRSLALQGHGLSVDCAATAEQARTLWSPGSHELVLIEFRNAAPAAHEFYREVRLSSKKQKVGFYVKHPPHVTRSYGECESMLIQTETPLAGTPRQTPGYAGHGNTQPGLSEAARQIATVRRLVHGVRPVGAPEMRPVPVADAMRVARRLPGVVA